MYVFVKRKSKTERSCLRTLFFFQNQQKNTPDITRQTLTAIDPGVSTKIEKV
jgi:hypothetical protein